MNSSEMPRSKNYTGEVLGLHFTALYTPPYVTTTKSHRPTTQFKAKPYTHKAFLNSEMTKQL